MTTPRSMELQQRLNRASIWRMVAGMLLSSAVLVAGLIQPAGTYPPEVKVPATYPITLGR